MNYSLAAQQLPVTPIEDLFGDCGLVVIAPHPDDETLGCGGILAWAARRDVLRHVVFLTNGEQSHPGASQDVASIRRHEAITASAHLGLAPTQLSFLGLPDSGLLALAADARQWTVHWLRCLAAERPPVRVPRDCTNRCPWRPSSRILVGARRHPRRERRKTHDLPRLELAIG